MLNFIRLFVTTAVLLLSGVGLALFLIYYGVRAGIVGRKIRIFRLMDFEVEGKEAVQNGWFYILLGAVILALSLRIILTHYQAIFHLIRLK